MTLQRSVVIVEDDDAIREFLLFALESHGYDARGARDGLEALDLLDQLVPDVVLTDLEMPRLDGWQLITILRFDPKASQVPIVVLSATVDPSSEDELGAQAVIRKPFRLEVLMQVLETVLQ